MDVGPLHHLLERRQEHVAQGTRCDHRRPDIGAAFRLAVAGHVFQRGENFAVGQGQRVALQPPHGGDAQFADQIGILAEGFLDAAPTRIARHVDHR